jgi:hypothetical protein
MRGRPSARDGSSAAQRQRAAAAGRAPLTRDANLLIKDVNTLAGRAAPLGTAGQVNASAGSIGDSACDVVAVGLLYAIGVESKAATAALRPAPAAPDAAVPLPCASTAVAHARTAYASVTKMLLVDAIRAVAAAGGDSEVAQPCLTAMEALLRGLPRGGGRRVRRAPLSANVWGRSERWLQLCTQIYTGIKLYFCLRTVSCALHYSYIDWSLLAHWQSNFAIDHVTTCCEECESEFNSYKPN